METYAQKPQVSSLSAKQQKELENAIAVLKPNANFVISLLQSISSIPGLYQVSESDLDRIAPYLKSRYGDKAKEEAKTLVKEIQKLGEGYNWKDENSVLDYNEKVANLLYERFYGEKTGAFSDIWGFIKGVYNAWEDVAGAIYKVIKEFWGDIPGIRGESDFIHKGVDGVRIAVEVLVKASATLSAINATLFISALAIAVAAAGAAPVGSTISAFKSLREIANLVDPKKNIEYSGFVSLFTPSGAPELSFNRLEYIGK